MQANTVNHVAIRSAALSLVLLQATHLHGQVALESVSDDVAATPKTSVVRLMVQPMIYNPEKWENGQRLTIKFELESDAGSRIFGIATYAELVATKTYANRWEMMLRTSPEDVEKILAAANLSEYGFTVTPFVEKHRELVAREPDVREFLSENNEYRPADGSNWGLNSRSKKPLRKPTTDELPVRAKQSRTKP